jgi:hypothetical protein
MIGCGVVRGSSAGFGGVHGWWVHVKEMCRSACLRKGILP